MIKLAIPYQSQHNNAVHGDCGYACVAMLLMRPINEVISETRHLNSGSFWLSFQELYQILAHYRLPYLYKRFYGPDGRLQTEWLRETLAAKMPVVVLANYAAVPNRQSSFDGAHWFLVVGCDPGGFYVHDSNWYGEREQEGAYLYLTDDQLGSMMQRPGKGIGISYQGVVIKRPYPVYDAAEDDEPESLRREIAEWRQRAQQAEAKLSRIAELLTG